MTLILPRTMSISCMNCMGVRWLSFMATMLGLVTSSLNAETGMWMRWLRGLW